MAPVGVVSLLMQCSSSELEASFCFPTYDHDWTRLGKNILPVALQDARQYAQSCLLSACIANCSTWRRGLKLELQVAWSHFCWRA